MGKKPRRASPREINATSQSTAIEETLPGSFESPESSTIQCASYDQDTESLTVVFRHGGGTTYTYPQVPHIIWREFLEAESKGHYFQSSIRPIFVGKRVTA